MIVDMVRNMKWGNALVQCSLVLYSATRSCTINFCYNEGNYANKLQYALRWYGPQV
jgi:hypothetical protein